MSSKLGLVGLVWNSLLLWSDQYIWEWEEILRDTQNGKEDGNLLVGDMLNRRIPVHNFFLHFPPMSIGKNILKHRKAAGLSQADLADKTLLSLRTIQRIENAQNQPRGYTIKVIAEALNVEPAVLTEEQEMDNRIVLKRLESINLSVLLFVIIPFGNLIFPILLWNRHAHHELIDEVGRRIINFQITWSLITYFLLAVSPFAGRWAGTSFPILFTVLIAAYVINISVVIRTASRIKAESYEVSKFALKLL